MLDTGQRDGQNRFFPLFSKEREKTSDEDLTRFTVSGVGGSVCMG